MGMGMGMGTGMGVKTRFVFIKFSQLFVGDVDRGVCRVSAGRFTETGGVVDITSSSSSSSSR